MAHEEAAGSSEISVNAHITDPVVTGERSMRFSLYPNRSRPSSSKGNKKSTSASPTSITPNLPPIPTTNPVESFSSMPGNSSRPQPSQRSSSNDSYRSSASPAPHNRKLRHIPSEASRLRSLNNGYTPQPTDVRPLHEVSQPENFSRPRKSSIIRNSEDLHNVPLQSTSSTSFHGGNETLSSMSRDRGLSSSSSSSRPISTFPGIALRPSMSIPDLNSSDAHSRPRIFTNASSYQARKGHTMDSYVSHLREPQIRPNGFESEEVRASFRSALTTSSSFLGTSGTERSSVMTKSSSATSIFGRDESFSVDDAIGMYENGFGDSGAEDGYGSRPHTSLSHRSDQQVNHREVKDDDLNVPGNIIMRDSNAFFQEPMDFRSLDGNPEFLLTLKPFYKSESRMPPTRMDYGQSTHSTSRDGYGFLKKSQHVSLEVWELWNGPYQEYVTRRRKKWVLLLKDSGLSSENPTSFPPQSKMVKRFVRKGIPPDWRGAAWFWYAGGPAMVDKHPGLYQALCKEAVSGALSATDEELIERDLNRTFPDNVKFKPDPVLSPENQNLTQMPETPLLQSLRCVLQAFAIYNPKIGYCQSLNFLAGLLLLFMDEEKSFWLLNIITRVYLPGTHEINLEGANVDLGVLMISIKESMPAIWAKIGGELDGSAGDGDVSMRLPPITLCCTAWFMSCFIGTLPIETTLRVWDCFFYEGSKTLFRIALAIFKVGETEIRAVSDPMEIFQVVQTIPRRLVDANALLDACFKLRNGFGHLSQDKIEARRAQRRAGYAEERKAKAAGVSIPVIARKNTLFRRRGRMRAVESP